MNLRKSVGSPPCTTGSSERSTVNVAAALAAASRPAPDNCMAEPQIVTGIEPGWKLWAWCLALVLFAGTATAVLIVSLLQTTPERTIESRREAVASGSESTRRSEPVRADNDAEARPVEPDTAAAATVPTAVLPAIAAQVRNKHETASVGRRSTSRTAHKAAARGRAGKDRARHRHAAPHERNAGGHAR